MEEIAQSLLEACCARAADEGVDVLSLYADERYRKRVVAGIRNETVRRFWTYEFENYHFRMKADAVAPIQNKLGALLSDPTLHRILVAPKRPIRFRSLMDEGQVSSQRPYVPHWRRGLTSSTCDLAHHLNMAMNADHSLDAYYKAGTLPIGSECVL